MKWTPQGLKSDNGVDVGCLAATVCTQAFKKEVKSAYVRTSFGVTGIEVNSETWTVIPCNRKFH